jgi:hypothetical protein
MHQRLTLDGATTGDVHLKGLEGYQALYYRVHLQLYKQPFSRPLPLPASDAPGIPGWGVLAMRAEMAACVASERAQLGQEYDAVISHLEGRLQHFRSLQSPANLTQVGI